MPADHEPRVRDAPDAPAQGGPRSNAGPVSFGAPSAGKSSVMSTDHKNQAKRLRTSLADRGVEVTHSEALELVAQQYGARDWNTLAAQPPTAEAPKEFGPVIPVLRIFDVAKAREFYTDFLGFAIDWEHTFEDHMPVYLQASRDGCPAAPQRAPRRRQPGRDRAHPRHRRDAAAPRAARARVPLRAARRRDPALGSRGRGPGPVRQPDRLPPARRGAVAPEGGGTAAGPIEHEYDVACTPEHAFDGLHRGIGDWWPAGVLPARQGERGHRTRGSGAPARCCSPTDGVPLGARGGLDPPGALRHGLHPRPGPRPSEPDRRLVHRCGDGTTRMRFSHGGWTAGNVAGRARFSEWPIILERFVARAEGRELPTRGPGD